MPWRANAKYGKPGHRSTEVPGIDVSIFWRGAAIGFALAAPVGAIGLRCIRRTLADGRRAGFVTGVGAASAGVLYGAVAALGLSSVSSLLIERQGLACDLTEAWS